MVYVRTHVNRHTANEDSRKSASFSFSSAAGVLSSATDGMSNWAALHQS